MFKRAGALNVPSLRRRPMHLSGNLSGEERQETGVLPAMWIGQGPIMLKEFFFWNFCGKPCVVRSEAAKSLGVMVA